MVSMPLSVSAWVYPVSAPAGYGTVLSMWDAATNRVHYLDFRLGSGYYTRAGTSSGVGSGGAVTAPPTSVGVWTHIAGVWSTNSARKVYRDYSNSATNSTATTGFTPDVTAIGRLNWAGSYTNYADAYIAEVGLWSTNLDDLEIKALSQGISPLLIRPQSLAAYWPLGGRYGQFDLDRWKNGYDMTAYNTPTWADHCRVIYPRPLILGVPIGGLTHYTMPAAAASFSLTGQNAGLLAGRKIDAGAASFALTGQDAGLLAARKIGGGAASFALTGQDAGLVASRKMSAGAGSFALTCQDAGLVASRKMPAGAGSFALTGQDSGLVASRKMPAAAGSLSLSGQDAGLVASRKMPAAAGSLSLSGQDAGLVATRKIGAGAASFALTGQDAGLFIGRAIVAARGQFTMAGQAATLTKTELPAGIYYYLRTAV